MNKTRPIMDFIHKRNAQNGLHAQARSIMVYMHEESVFSHINQSPGPSLMGQEYRRLLVPDSNPAHPLSGNTEIVYCIIKSCRLGYKIRSMNTLYHNGLYA